MLLLDANVLSQLRRRDRANKTVLAWADGQDTEALYLPSITVLEIEQGVLEVGRHDSEHADRSPAWLTSVVVPALENLILAFDVGVALACAALHVPNPRPERHSMIAATALAQDMTVVTRNTRDVEPMGVKLLNPRVPA